MTTIGNMPNGEPIERVSLRGSDLSAEIMTYGASLLDLRLDGVNHSLVLSLPTSDDYLTHDMYLGANVGRFANRIENGHLSIGTKTWQLDQNFNNKHTLHGGKHGTSARNWKIVSSTQNSVVFEDFLPDQHMGFPGNLKVQLTYTIDGNTLTLNYHAVTDAPTICSFSHHSYFNLAGSGTICDHTLQVLADTYLPVDQDCIPIGDPVSVNGTVFDFKTPRPLCDNPLDHNFCLSTARQPLRNIAKLSCTKSAVEMTLATTEPGLQVYDGEGLDSNRDLKGQPYFSKKSGIALEPQCWPDAPNRETFPSALLKLGEQYKHRSTYTFLKTTEL